MSDVCEKFGHEYEFSTYCGAHVCLECDDHKGLARCFCGWSASGGDGRWELEAMGETIEADDDYYGQLNDDWVWEHGEW